MKPAPITAFVGINGAGKTLSAIAFAHKSGRRVLTNVPGTAFEEWASLEDLTVPGAIRDTDVIMDEAGVMFSSRNASRDGAFLALVQQLRKENARLFWTAPAYMRADKILREVTQMVVKCRGLASKYPDGAVWPQPRWVANFAYEAGDHDNIGLRMKDSQKRVGMTFWRVASQGALFDTLGRVDADAAARTSGPSIAPDPRHSK